MRMSGGEAVIRSLAAHGVRTVFGIPGTHNLAIYEALAESPHIRHVSARHEQGAAFMADGYARASGEVGVCLSTTGPAALNTITPLGTAFGDSSPVLSIASQIPAQFIGQDKGFLHECQDQLACFRPVSAWCHRPMGVSGIPWAVGEAMARMRTGRPRPTAIEVPCDVLDTEEDVAIPPPREVTVERPDGESIQRAADVLRQARRPVIWAGGGVISSGASDALVQLAAVLQAPVFVTTMGKGAIPEDHPLAAGHTMLHPVGREYLAGCDVMLAVGTRFAEMDTKRWTLKLPDRIVQIDVDPASLGTNYPVHAPVLSDARTALTALLEQLGPRGAGEDRGGEVAELWSRLWSESERRAPQVVQMARDLQAVLPRDAILVNDLTIAVYWCQLLLRVYEPRTYLYPWSFCTLGFGLPAAIGAKLARPDRPVVLMTGDGGMMFNCQELATAVELDLPLVMLVFNDGGYGVLRIQQQARYGRTHGVDLGGPDFVKLAQAFGARGERLESIGDIGAAVSRGLDANGPYLVEVPVTLPWPTVETAGEFVGKAVRSSAATPGT